MKRIIVYITCILLLGGCAANNGIDNRKNEMGSSLTPSKFA